MNLISTEVNSCVRQNAVQNWRLTKFAVSEHMALLTVVAWRGTGLDGGGWGQKPSSVHAYLVWSWDAEFLGGAKVFLGGTPPENLTAGTWKTPPENGKVPKSSSSFLGSMLIFRGVFDFFHPTKLFKSFTFGWVAWSFLFENSLKADRRGLLILKFGFGMGQEIAKLRGQAAGFISCLIIGVGLPSIPM